MKLNDAKFLTEYYDENFEAVIRISGGLNGLGPTGPQQDPLHLITRDFLMNFCFDSQNLVTNK